MSAKFNRCKAIIKGKKGTLPVCPGNIEDELTAVEDVETGISVMTDDGFIAAISKILQFRDVFKTSFANAKHN